MLAEVPVQPLDARLDDLLFVVHRERDVDRRDLRSVRTGLMGMSDGADGLLRWRCRQPWARSCTPSL